MPLACATNQSIIVLFANIQFSFHAKVRLRFSQSLDSLSKFNAMQCDSPPPHHDANTYGNISDPLGCPLGLETL